MLEGQFRVFEDNLATTLSSMEGGIRQLRNDRRKKLRRSRRTQQTMYTQRVSPPGDDTDQGSSNIVEVWICFINLEYLPSANKNDKDDRTC